MKMSKKSNKETGTSSSGTTESSSGSPPTEVPSFEKEAEKITEKWTASTSNIMEITPEADAEAQSLEQQQNAPPDVVIEERSTKMLGFSSFLIGVKSVTIIIYLVLLIVSVILLDSSFFYTILAFWIAELVLIGITIYHGFRPALKVVLTMLGFEMTLSLVKLVFAIVLMAKDGGSDCSKDHPCSILNISVEERFYLFFFILFTAFADGLTALLTIANSPQMHEFELGDEFLF